MNSELAKDGSLKEKDKLSSYMLPPDCWDAHDSAWTSSVFGFVQEEIGCKVKGWSSMK